MRCESCGTDLPEDAAFCPECGERNRALSAGEMIDLTHTSGLVRGREAGEVPSVPEPAGAPEGTPEIPDAAPLPDASGGAIPTGQAAATDATALSGVDRARLREEARRAAQALAETAQDTLREELAEIAEKETLIEQLGQEVEEVSPSEEPPPPSAEERMWDDTQERARLHGVGMPWGEETVSGGGEGDGADERIGEKIEAAAEEDGGKCCAWGCATLSVLLFLFFILSFILNVAQ
ncbi:MAG: zinc-ribbon domain-containing protein [Armatimonadota bacterium]